MIEIIALSIISLFLLSLLGTNLYYFKRQIVYTTIGFIIIYLMLFFDFRELKYFAWILYTIGIIALVAVMFLGRSAYGAQRWISLGNLFSIQPSEFEKPILIIFLAYIVSKEELTEFKKFIYLTLAFLIPFFLIFKQPDLGTDIVMFSIFIFILFFFLNLKYFILVVTSIVAFIPIGLKFLKPYQLQRIMVFLNPNKDPLGSGYNVIQSIIAIGSGELFGKGISKNIFTKLHFVPVQYADFIFSALGETLGFLGVIILLLLYIGVMIFIIKTYRLTKDDFGKAMLIGVFTIFITQIFINIGMCVGIMPVTGVPLPFISFGGSATLTNFIAIGLAINIYVYREEINIL
jgi:rod shape determining protein RodA